MTKRPHTSTSATEKLTTYLRNNYVDLRFPSPFIARIAAILTDLSTPRSSAHRLAYTFFTNVTWVRPADRYTPKYYVPNKSIDGRTGEIVTRTKTNSTKKRRGKTTTLQAGPRKQYREELVPLPPPTSEAECPACGGKHVRHSCKKRKDDYYVVLREVDADEADADEADADKMEVDGANVDQGKASPILNSSAEPLPTDPNTEEGSKKEENAVTAATTTSAASSSSLSSSKPSSQTTDLPQPPATEAICTKSDKRSPHNLLTAALTHLLTTCTTPSETIRIINLCSMYTSSVRCFDSRPEVIVKTILNGDELFLLLSSSSGDCFNLDSFPVQSSFQRTLISSALRAVDSSSSTSVAEKLYRLGRRCIVDMVGASWLGGDEVVLGVAREAARRLTSADHQGDRRGAPAFLSAVYAVSSASRGIRNAIHSKFYEAELSALQNKSNWNLIATILMSCFRGGVAGDDFKYGTHLLHKIVSGANSSSSSYRGGEMVRFLARRSAEDERDGGKFRKVMRGVVKKAYGGGRDEAIVRVLCGDCSYQWSPSDGVGFEMYQVALAYLQLTEFDKGAIILLNIIKQSRSPMTYNWYTFLHLLTKSLSFPASTMRLQLLQRSVAFLDGVPSTDLLRSWVSCRYDFDMLLATTLGIAKSHHLNAASDSFLTGASDIRVGSGGGFSGAGAWEGEGSPFDRSALNRRKLPYMWKELAARFKDIKQRSYNLLSNGDNNGNNSRELELCGAISSFFFRLTKATFSGPGVESLEATAGKASQPAEKGLAKDVMEDALDSVEKVRDAGKLIEILTDKIVVPMEQTRDIDDVVKTSAAIACSEIAGRLKLPFPTVFCKIKVDEDGKQGTSAVTIGVLADGCEELKNIDGVSCFGLRRGCDFNVAVSGVINGRFSKMNEVVCMVEIVGFDSYRSRQIMEKKGLVEGDLEVVEETVKQAGGSEDEEDDDEEGGGEKDGGGEGGEDPSAAGVKDNDDEVDASDNGMVLKTTVNHNVANILKGGKFHMTIPMFAVKSVGFYRIFCRTFVREEPNSECWRVDVKKAEEVLVLVEPHEEVFGNI